MLSPTVKFGVLPIVLGPVTALTLVLNSSYGASNLFFGVLNFAVRNNTSDTIVVNYTSRILVSGSPAEGALEVNFSNVVTLAPGATTVSPMNIRYESYGGAPVASGLVAIGIPYNITVNKSGGGTANATGNATANWQISGAAGAVPSINPNPYTYSGVIDFF